MVTSLEPSLGCGSAIRTVAIATTPVVTKTWKNGKRPVEKKNEKKQEEEYKDIREKLLRSIWWGHIQEFTKIPHGDTRLKNWRLIQDPYAQLLIIF